MNDTIALIASGYARTSNRYRMVSRIDRPDWKEHMASTHVGGMGWVNALGYRLAAYFYRRCLSKDNLEGLAPSEFKKFPASHMGPTKYAKRKETP